jgi:hypothetical protein
MIESVCQGARQMPQEFGEVGTGGSEQHVHRVTLVIVTTIPFVHVNIRQQRADESVYLIERGSKRVPIVGIAAAQQSTNEPVITIGCCNGHFLTELKSLVRFAFADALHVRFVQAVDFVFV